MTPAAARHRPARPWTALLAFAALAVLASRSAEAGCHGRVAIQGGATLSNLEAFIEGESFGAAATPAEAPAPCTGAFCSGSPATPATSTSVPIVAPGSWAIVAVLRDDRDPASEPHFWAEPPRPPLRLSVGVFHPPRALDARSR
ncbi:hypothetical protein [Paludisphaera sp.]|uniref:hypothetical protein n=1 Tax=Paludisphaera sp. TaxID=2017432 RepID=UPI00301BC0CC